MSKDESDIGDGMPIFRLIVRARNVLPFREAKSTSQRKFSLVELQELAEREEFDKILTAAGVPNTPIPKTREEKWDDLVEFDCSEFDEAAYWKY